ncbi:MAG: DUF3365 domain-containing protein [Verrucomicrobiae bacterium]|nr:DUF3365 domain-containing protein [Verrucomicrobiae bacterium]
MSVKLITQIRWGVARHLFLLGGSVAMAMGTTGLVTGEEVEEPVVASRSALPSTIEEARARARWMHELVHGALQVMHRDFFDENAAEKSLPSQSLDDVFAEMARSHSVEIRWLGGNANKGKDHLPQDAFEEKAVAALISGKPEFEALERGRYRFVGPIRMQNQCLKCHVRDRKSLEDRVAGLAISFPMAQP